MSSKSSFSNSTSKSYAIALYELSKEGSEIDKIEEDKYECPDRNVCIIIWENYDWLFHLIFIFRMHLAMI